MANEISLTAKISVSKNSVTATNATSTKTQTMESTLEKMHHTVQSVGTSREAVSTGDVDTSKEYFVLLYNRDDTNFVAVEIEYSDGNWFNFAVIRPGEMFGPVRMKAIASPGANQYGELFLDADTAACDVEVLVCDAGNPAA